MAKALWTGAELLAMGFRIAPASAAEDLRITGVSIDSRGVVAGDLFVAIRGEARDGHDFAGAALRSHAAAALVDHDPGCEPGSVLVYTEDTQSGLEELGKAARERATDALRIAVTGSVGKTSTKEALLHVLSGFGPAHASVASYNNLWGVPLTLARMPAKTRFGIFEIGMNHAGEITPLARQVAPDIAIITTVEAVHLEHFDSVEGIADAKAEIFAGLRPCGVAILNRDNPYYDRLRASALLANPEEVIGFGEAAEADMRLVAFDPQADGSRISIEFRGTSITTRLSSPGKHNALNALAVLAASHLAGIDLREAASRLEGWTPPSGRGAREECPMPGGSFTLVDESYNANPASMRAALSNLADAVPGPGGRRIAVLGDMLELGACAAEFHADLSGAASAADLVFVSGPLMKSLHDALPAERRAGWADTSNEIAPAVTAEIRPGDVVMIKGSLGSKMKHVVERLRALSADPDMTQ